MKKLKILNVSLFVSLFYIITNSNAYHMNISSSFFQVNNYSKVLNRSFPDIIDDLNITELDLIAHEPTLAKVFKIIEDAPPDPPVFQLDLCFVVRNFLMFDPTTGSVKVSASLQYKWWNDKSEFNNSAFSYRPVIIFKEDLEDKIIEEYKKDNYLVVHNRNEEFNIKRLYHKHNEATIFDYQYSALEQNVTLKFKCQLDGRSRDFLDTSKFPFDSHACKIDLYIDVQPVGRPKPHKGGKVLKRNYSHNVIKPKFSLINQNINYNLHKLVTQPNGNSLVSRDWILKKLSLYTNSTDISNRGLRKDSDGDISKISIKFFIYRRRETQVFVFILPLGIFTCITFLVFVIPPENSGEKTLLTFLNFICLLVYNAYLFQLIIYTYEFVNVPQILQYSSCLMALQLVVFLYVCLVKLVYYYGCFSCTNRHLSNLVETSYKRILSGKTVQNKYELFPHYPSVKQALNRNGKVKMNVELQDFDPSCSDETLDTSEMNNIAQTKIKRRCHCNMMETDADCSNVILENGSGICMNFSEESSSKCPSYDLQKSKSPSNIEVHQQKIIVTNLETSKNESFQFINGNWVLTQNLPNTIPFSLKKSKKSEATKKHYPCCVESGSAKSLPDYDCTSHLARAGKKTYVSGLDSICECPKNSTFKNNTLIQGSDRNLIFGTKHTESNLYNEIHSNAMNTLDSANVDSYIQCANRLINNSSVEITKINQNLNKLADIEEMNVKEKILQNRWRRNARCFDGACCLIVFFLLSSCSIFIFWVCPILKIAMIFD